LRRITASIKWRRLIIACLAGFGVLVLVLAAVIGAPVNSSAGITLLLVVLGVGVHFSLGTLAGALMSGNGRNEVRRRVAERTLGYTIAVLVFVAALDAVFWYVVLTYSTSWPWLVGVAVVAFGTGVLVSLRAAHNTAGGSAKALGRISNITNRFEPTAALIGGLTGLVAAFGLLWWSAAADTGASQHAPSIVALPSTGPDAAYRDYVVLGDSYSAGEGLDPTGQCHQSTQAYGRLLGTAEHWHVELDACSGAVISDVFNPTHYGPQVTGAKKTNVGLVTLTIGGNDSLFSKVVLACVSHPSCMWGNFPPANVKEEVPVLSGHPVLLEHQWAPMTMLTIGDELGAPHTGLFARLRDHFPNARIVVIGYPYLFPDGPAPLAPDLMCAAVLRRVDEPDRAEIRYMQDRFNDVIFEAAMRQGVDFVNPNLLWAGHEPCGAHGQWTNSIETYLNFTKPLGTGPFHPNSAGQEALAALVSCYLHNNSEAPTARPFSAPAGWLTPPSALTLANGQPFPHEWGSLSSDFAGCGFPEPAVGTGP
jgi:lysophospholipase L1-like esterase